VRSERRGRALLLVPAVARSGTLIVTLTPGDEDGWRPSVVHPPSSNRPVSRPSSADELLDTGRSSPSSAGALSICVTYRPIGSCADHPPATYLDWRPWPAGQGR